MPELPEVETVRRGLEPKLRGRILIDAIAHESAKFQPALDAVGSAIDAVSRRGKYLRFELDDGRELLGHLGMTGSFAVEDGSDDEVALAAYGPHCRAVWRLDDGHELVFRDTRRFGRLHVVEAGDYRRIPTLHHMGPEPFDPAFNAQSLQESIRRSNRAIKTQLLSQRPVAGVGNIYADEALFLASIHPLATSIGRTRSQRLVDAIRNVLTAGIDNGGTTLRDYVNVDGGEGRNQHELVAYGRGGMPCIRCGSPMRQRVVDARTTTFCSACQRR